MIQYNSTQEEHQNISILWTFLLQIKQYGKKTFLNE